YDFVAMHHYTQPPAVSVRNPDDIHDYVMEHFGDGAAALRRTRAMIRRNAGSRAAGIDIIVSEYGLAGFGASPTHYALSLDNAIFTTLQLFGWMKLGVTVAERHALIDFPFVANPPGSSNPTVGPDYSLIGPGPDYKLSA